MSEPESREAGEQFAEDLEQAVEDQIDRWLNDNSSSAYLDGGYVSIRREELVEKLLLMNAITAMSFAEE